MRELLWNGPIGERRMDAYLRALEPTAGQTVLDVGCGCGEVLIRLSCLTPLRGRGIDVDAELLTEARRRQAEAAPTADLQFEQADLQQFDFKEARFDVAMCWGASHAFQEGPTAYAVALQQMTSLLRPGGLLLIAEGYFRQHPAAEYLKFLGDSMDPAQTHAQNVAKGQAQGLVALGAWTSSVEEWDTFEWSYQRVIERIARQRPQDAAAQARLVRRRAWMDAYLRWGRDTLGYGIYLFERPAAAVTN